ncbi:structural maintenance of chromosomes protein 6B-like isoform X2 [Diospyros lotus]|uniref:structural maintenance of chromosomes protein 6B-like isoform X2 n=1 Tax=Diospyros lotus TaxID=55363 RepID=UPI0022589721|nr:structural maintenance of chromosomes protein 6B-like isoform X2 [Diospyros lotus]
MTDGDSRGFAGSTSLSNRSQAGIISKIRLENFMCHSSLVIELGDWVNFITGQNGSGKSAILTALCVAFGSRAKGTQRATTLKDFIKTGCSYAVVNVEIKNQGEDAFKPDVYGDVIIVERRISDTTSSTVLKNCQGRKVAGRKEDLREIIEHFNIDVENPCVIMTQDKSREFLHSGNDKDKFKFFFKATLLYQVDELLKSIKSQLVDANQLVDELESLIRPIQKELNELQMKIKSMEHVEEISQQVQLLKKKLAWSWVYDTDRQLQEHRVKIETLKSRIPKCQAKIDRQIGKMEELRDLLTKKKTQIALMMERTAKVRRMKDELQQSLSLAAKERLELEENHHRKIDHIQKMVKQVKLLEQQIDHIHEQHIKSTQAEEYEIEERLKELHDQYDAANTTLSRLREEEEALSQTLFMRKEEVEKFAREIEENERRHREIFSQIHDLRLHQTNKVTAFGGFRVTNLLQTIERHHHRFKRPPIGPIGAHLSLLHGDMWAVAVENAIGKLLNAFVVTDHKDSVFLRGCAREAGYNHLQIIIYDFARPRLNIPNHMLPQTKHPTTISVLHSDSPTILNVLVDLGSAERQVLVRNYDVGKSVAFEQKILNLKEVYTSDGYRMFSRGSAQTILPPNKRARTSRLCGSYDDQIKNLERDALNAKEHTEQARRRKRETEEGFQELNNKFQSVKESHRKASIICPESDIEALGGCQGSTPEQLSAQLTRLNQRFQRESERYTESIDDLRMLYEKKERKILRKQQTYKAFREKLNACQKALELRWSKFQRNATLLKRQLTWQFNGHLRKKGISGHVKVSYEEQTLSIEVKMPQDASHNNVRDTRGLSGGERSFSTLCFALALHEMTEAPFRAMDEFDVFMDAVSRKISLDALVDFALAQGSQWIFITPHDISVVKQGERIKKQQMAAPRS